MPEKAVYNNNIAHATNGDFISQYAFGKSSFYVGDMSVSASGLACLSFASSLLKQHRIGTETAEKYQAIGRETAEKQQTNSREIASKVQGCLQLEAEARQRITKAEAGGASSDFLLTNFTPTPRFSRVGFELASIFHSLKCMPTRKRIEENCVKGRKRAEESMKKVRNNTPATSDGGLLFLSSSIPAPNQIRTLFYLQSSLHRMCAAFAPSLHREKDSAGTLQVLRRSSETYKRVRSGLKEGPNKVAIISCQIIHLPQ